jgi:hypothetical protein
MSAARGNPADPSPVAYEQKLDADWGWALAEGSRFFEERGAVYDTLRRITRKINEIGIPYAVAGGMALARHGFRRFTEDVDLLVTREGWQRVHQHLDGLGFVPPFRGSKSLRDVETGVRIEFLITGDYPGDGKPKPVAFPDPLEASSEVAGIRVVNLPKLIELKLASGMTSPGRLKDLADVQELIKALNLPREFADQLAPYVREKFVELWTPTQS